MKRVIEMAQGSRLLLMITRAVFAQIPSCILPAHCFCAAISRGSAVPPTGPSPYEVSCTRKALRAVLST